MSSAEDKAREIAQLVTDECDGEITIPEAGIKAFTAIIAEPVDGGNWVYIEEYDLIVDKSKPFDGVGTYWGGISGGYRIVCDSVGPADAKRILSIPTPPPLRWPESWTLPARVVEGEGAHKNRWMLIGVGSHPIANMFQEDAEAIAAAINDRNDERGK